MTEYIEREAISEEIRKYYYKNPPNFSYGEGFDRGLDRAQRAILDAPAADVAGVVFARWEEADWREYDAQSCETIRYPKAAIACTNCRCAFKKDALWKRNFCPSCGAKMDGGDGNGAMA